MLQRSLLALFLVLACTTAAAGQAGSCNLIESGRIEKRNDDGIPIVIFHDPFFFRCGGGAELRANQGTLNEWTRELVLSGNVFFQDPDQTLTAQHATYSSPIGRLYATGDVVFTNRREGSTIRGPELEYFRPIQGRPEAQVNATQRPHLTLRPKQARADSEPLELDADRVSIFGQDNLSAYGSVVIRRSDLHATSGEAQYNAATEGLELRQNARIQSKDYELKGEVIQARLAEGALQNVHARTRASVVGEELTVTAPDVQLMFEADLLQRVVARRPRGEGATDTARAVATARAFRLEADSIDALVPGQRLDQVIAIGAARGEAVDTARTDSMVLAAADAPADSAAPTDTAAVGRDSSAVLAASLLQRDWIVGDTLIGYFAPADTASTEGADTAVVLKRIVARGSAQSLYRAQPVDTASTARRGINYLSGEVIELTFADGELHLAEVSGLRRGLYLDPVPPAGSSPTGTNTNPPPGPVRRGRP